ncbi:hypothetical protein GCM10011575_47480 [Microlunatus endophyticus]|uniref:Uncharacterized protein n=1 Tax=Microlunatus endophyticus TaxID=1716077 RepID=A0A917WA99_9ACTN|nr:hypothetical protein [Microlunatus endophyticus]GGL83636.1 hypothetical protein GCM10011575_47480 [Microlunatus endophyticus]
MGYIDDEGLHEARLAPEFLDGARGIGTMSGKVPNDHVIVDAQYVGEPGSPSAETRYASRPAAEVIGWRVVCECSTPTSYGAVSNWVSDLLVRVPTAALEDLAAGRIYATDDQTAGWLDDSREDVADLAVKIWREQHLAIPTALGRLERARWSVESAQRALDAAAVDARTAGASWDAIGRAAGMTRQSAHQRWAHLTTELV